jgi:hypothetical protein
VKKTTSLKIRGITWLIPFIIPALPFLILPLMFDKAEDFCHMMRRKIDQIADRTCKFLMPPAWWPSHRIFKELDEEREQIREARRARCKERTASRVQNIEHEDAL